ncbi:RNA-directed DNA polymerase [Staphylococcus aureus]|uniref:retron St85 family RNA-directed DNA polymerase n=1 Tax=Staphylococcus aureus TaxID=1280 RepID=UPI0012AF294D|nr:retron St85 family RNA-directed DNA polymerase [Staphylococcus aureus]MBG1199874.1 RNA-directed DNA polymerase [Staphylococcus aureus]MRV00184.1 RNA-directed DNA polymerase [Staphylococcus aureus]
MEKIENEIVNKTYLAINSLEELRNMIGIKSDYFYKCLYVNDHFYNVIKIPKRKKDEYRELMIPNMALKNIQRWILDNVLYRRQVHKCATGFVPRKSIVNNVIPHVGQKYILKMDIENFFPSITFKQVRKIFSEMGYKFELATALANLCTVNNQLPQGAPTSPYIANIIFYNIDKRIFSYCQKNNLRYTRYADDITISGSNKVSFSKEIIREIVNQYNFRINESKTIMFKPGDRKKVTGIIVNEKISVPKTLIREVRKQIYFVNKFGLEEHLIRNNYSLDYEQQFIMSIYGKISFIKMIDFKKGVSLQKKFNEVLGNIESSNMYRDNIDFDDIELHWIN